MKRVFEILIFFPGDDPSGKVCKSGPLTKGEVHELLSSDDFVSSALGSSVFEVTKAVWDIRGTATVRGLEVEVPCTCCSKNVVPVSLYAVERS